jgi:TatD family-associated radical SAM protein
LDTLDTLAYGIEDRLYLNITDRCTLRCQFCPKSQGRYALRRYNLRLQALPTEDQLLNALPADFSPYQEVVFCGYGEPTLRLKLLLKTAQHIKAMNPHAHIRVNTDGLVNRVYRRNVLPLLQGNIDTLSVSLNAQDADHYALHCQPRFPDAYPALLAFLAEAPRWIPHVTATAIEGLSGVDIPACARLAARLGISFRARYLDRLG